jgi:hypothetical protein
LEEDLAMTEDDSDAFYEDELRGQERDADIDRLRHRMTLLFILIPCLLCAVFAFAYMDMRNRLNQLYSSGSQKVEALSEDIVQKVSSLSQHFEKLEESFGKRLSILKDVSVALQDDLKKSESKLNALASATIDKKTFDNATADLASLKESLAKQEAAIRGLSKKLQKELDQEANAITAFQSDLRVQGERFTETVGMIEDLQQKALKLELKTRLLSEKMVDKDAWEEANGKRALLEKKIKDLAEELAWLTKQLNLSRENKAVSGTGSSQPKKEKTEEPVSITIVPESGKIEEQDIKE